MSDETDPRVLAARLDLLARRQGAASALTSLADELDKELSFFDRIKPRAFADALRLEAKKVLNGESDDDLIKDIHP